MRSNGWVWFLSESLRYWEILSIGLTARQLGADGLRLTVISGSGFFPSSLVDVVSWKSLSGFRRARIASTYGQLWHLWGQQPRWWPLVRARSLTVHSLKGGNESWQGHPAEFSSVSEAAEDVNVWRPAFERDLAWGRPEDDQGEPMALVVFPSSTARPDRSVMDFLSRDFPWPLVKLSDQAGALFGAVGVVSETEAVRFLSNRGRLLVLPGVDVSTAILAAFASLYGVPTVSPWSPLLDDLLGPDGYIPLRRNELPKPLEVIGDLGRQAAIQGRHRIHDRCSSRESAETLQNIYRTLSEGRR
ncbi:MAG: hypothetical protein CSA35_07790 [Dethiosulfovibrio peptidovorans]|nr:MAG: hypothetical protein CSA35_07790 [Dethiosulfovibrio peptidovorans]